MNWMGGHLAQFKRKRVSKKEEERRRIEEYITKRQKKEVMAGDKHRQETSSSTDLFANPQNPLMITNNSKSTNYDQSALFSRSIDPALVANPWAGIDPNFLKPKVFPSYLKNIPKLYFDAAPGNFTAKSPETVIFSDNSLKQDFNFEASQNGTELPLHFDKNDVYGPVLTPSFSNFSPQQSSVRTQSYHMNLNIGQTFNSNESSVESSASSISPILPTSKSTNHTYIEADSIPSHYQSFKNYSPKASPKANINFNSFHSQLPNEWDFEEENEDFVIYEP